jgi:transcriptional regulator with GAF, ATPase, and Fis domain
MIEAELFGHARGAFTGAVATRGGRIAAADGGTLFLDEIGDMPLAAQAKLLRVLQDRTIMPVGADEPVTVDVRVVAATNRDLEQMVADGTFRGDLYFRLSVIPVHLPPLRERGQDVILLANAMLRGACERNGRSAEGFAASGERALLGHGWAGNVRELGHVVERAVLLKRSGRIGEEDLRLSLRPRKAAAQAPAPAPVSPAKAEPTAEPGLDLKRAIEQVERQLIDEALQRTNGNRTEAAALLGLNRTTLVEKLRKHGS